MEGYIQSKLTPAAIEITKGGRRKLILLLDAEEVPGFTDGVGEEFHRIMGGVVPVTGQAEYVRALVHRIRKMGLRAKCNGYPAINGEGNQTWVWLLRVKW